MASLDSKARTTRCLSFHRMIGMHPRIVTPGQQAGARMHRDRERRDKRIDRTTTLYAPV